MRLLSLIVFFLFLCSGAKSQTPKLLLFETALNAPLDADNADLDIILDEFYAYVKVGERAEQDSIFEVFNQHRDLIKSEQDSAYSFYCLGYLELRQSNYIDAGFYLKKAGILFEQTQDQLGILYTKHQMGNLHYFMKQTEEAILEYQEILSSPYKDNSLTATMHHNIGTLMLELDIADYTTDNDAKNQLKLAEIAAHYDEAIRIYEMLEDEKNMAGTYSVYLNVKIFQHDFEGAQMVLDSSEALAIRNNDIGRLAFLNIKKAALYDTLGYHQMAIDTALKATEYYISTENFDQEVHALWYVYRGYYKQKMFKEAADVLFKINLLDKKLLDKELTTNLTRYEAEFETEKKSLELERKQSQLEKEKLSNYNKNIIITTIIIVAIALLLLILLIQQ
jgi:tetratricopeptide (TPR) repeat protein